LEEYKFKTYYNTLSETQQEELVISLLALRYVETNNKHYQRLYPAISREKQDRVLSSWFAMNKKLLEKIV
jgi:hypothetical protein